MQAIACLPRLTEVSIDFFDYEGRIPVGVFSNLSKLSVSCSRNNHISFFVAQTATAIANSPHLRSLDVHCPSHSGPRPTLSDLFANVSISNPLFLDHLSIVSMDVTMDQVTLPHLTHLTSFEFDARDMHHSSAWTSFWVNNIKLSDVDIGGIKTNEAMLYLSSFSGLKRLVVGSVPHTMKSLKDIFFERVLPKHANSLQILELIDWVGQPIIPIPVGFSLTMSC
jgi:hypothetical protein